MCLLDAYLIDVEVFPSIVHQVAVRPPVDRALPEDHDVLRQRSRLVAEDVLYLPELLVQRCCPSDRGRVRGRVVHFLVVVDPD